MSEWDRTSAQKPCPICGKTDWCLVAKDKSAVICPRKEEGSKKYIDGSGYLHVLIPGKYEKKNPEWKSELPEHNTVMGMLAKKYIAAFDDKSKAVGDLGVSADSLAKLFAGWSSANNGVTFPMFRHRRRVIGIRIRTVTGKKFAVKGSKQGLFLPRDWDSEDRGVLVCEGPTDTAAAIDLGFSAIGRPSCMGGSDLIAEAVAKKHVAIMADADGPGMDGANKLSVRLRTFCPSVKIIVPEYNDLREWVRKGATKQDVIDAIGRAKSA